MPFGLMIHRLTHLVGSKSREFNKRRTMKNTVLRNLLIAALAVLVLFTVAGVSYQLGVRQAREVNPAVARFDGDAARSQFSGRGAHGFGIFAQRGEDGGRAFVFGMGGRDFDRGQLARFPVARLSMLLIGATLLGMLVLGTIAFFRTGGWGPVPAGAAQPSRRKRS